MQTAAGVYAESPVFSTTGQLFVDGGWTDDFSAKTAAFVTIDSQSVPVSFTQGATHVRAVVIQ